MFLQWWWFNKIKQRNKSDQSSTSDKSLLLHVENTQEGENYGKKVDDPIILLKTT